MSYLLVNTRDDVRIGQIPSLVRKVDVLPDSARIFGYRNKPRLLMSLHPDDLGTVSIIPPEGFLDQLCLEFPRCGLRLLDAALRAKGEKHFGIGTEVQLMDLEQTKFGETLLRVEVCVVVKGEHPNKRQEKVAALNLVIWNHFGAKPGKRHTKQCDSGQKFLIEGEVVCSTWSFTTEFPI
jgi:hypothetical protein